MPARSSRKDGTSIKCLFATTLSPRLVLVGIYSVCVMTPRKKYELIINYRRLFDGKRVCHRAQHSIVDV